MPYTVHYRILISIIVKISLTLLARLLSILSNILKYISLILKYQLSTPITLHHGNSSLFPIILYIHRYFLHYVHFSILLSLHIINPVIYMILSLTLLDILFLLLKPLTQRQHNLFIFLTLTLNITIVITIPLLLQKTAVLDLELSTGQFLPNFLLFFLLLDLQLTG